jgi:hypothetical protein
MDFLAFVQAIGWWPTPIALTVGFIVGYVLRRSLWVLHVWPWGDFDTAIKVGTGAGVLFGIVGVQIRPILYELSLSDLAWFLIILLGVSCLAAMIGSELASFIQQRNLHRLDDKSFANVDTLFVFGFPFKRMDNEERKRRHFESPDVFVYNIPRSDGEIIYEPTFGIITDNSEGSSYRDPTKIRYWLASNGK